MISTCNSPTSICLGSLAIRPFRVHRGTVAGRAETLPTATMTTEERFWAKVDKNGPIQPHCPELGRCWLWKGSPDSDGHSGYFGFNRDRCRAYRFSWILHFGPIPKGLFVCHKCDNGLCVNPEHLFVGTQKDNIADASTKGRMVGASFPGELNTQSKLREQEILEIRNSIGSGVSQRILAAKYCVHQASIWKVIHGKSWKHLLQPAQKP